MANEIERAIHDETEATKAVEVTGVAEPTKETDEGGPAISDELRELLNKHGADSIVLSGLVSKGVESVEDLAYVSEEDLVSCGMKVVGARKLLASIARDKAEAEAKVAPTPTVITSDLAILPELPSDESWLAALKAGGVLKVNQDSYIAVIRAVYAERCGLYDAPKRLEEAMRSYAENADEPVGPEFFKLRKLLTRRSYADLFSAIDGLDGSFVTDSERKKFLKKVNAKLLPAIYTVSKEVNAWNETYCSAVNNPMALASLLTGGGTGLISQAPPFTGVQSATESLNDAINSVFGGLGGVIASALAYDAMETKKALENPQLPAMTGAANRDQMLRTLGLSISSSFVHQEKMLTRFVLAATKFSEISPGEEPRYLTALWQLSRAIDWSVLGFGSAGIAGLGGSEVL